MQSRYSSPVVVVFDQFLYHRQITQYMPRSLTSPFATRNCTFILQSTPATGWPPCSLFLPRERGSQRYTAVITRPRLSLVALWRFSYFKPSVKNQQVECVGDAVTSRRVGKSDGRLTCVVDVQRASHRNRGSARHLGRHWCDYGRDVRAECVIRENGFDMDLLALGSKK